MVLASEPVGGRSQATEFPCLFFIYLTSHDLYIIIALDSRYYIFFKLPECPFSCVIYTVTVMFFTFICVHLCMHNAIFISVIFYLILIYFYRSKSTKINNFLII